MDPIDYDNETPTFLYGKYSDKEKKEATPLEATDFPQTPSFEGLGKSTQQTRSVVPCEEEWRW